jgi:hypothetical protein
MPLISIGSRRAVGLAALVCAAGAASTALDVEADGLPAGALHVEKAMIVDATGFEAPLAATTLFLPAGWRSAGGVFWGQEFACTNGYNFNWTATSPDGRTSIAVLPQQKWESNNYGAAPSSPGCQAAPFTNVRQYLESIERACSTFARATTSRATTRS